MGNNPWSVHLTYPDRKVLTEGSETGLSVTVEDSRYTVVKCLLRVDGIQPEHFYAFHAAAGCRNVNYKLLYIWRDVQGKELAKGYFIPGRQVVSPGSSAWAEIEVLVYSSKPGEFRMQDMVFEDKGPYVPRKARICCISSHMYTDPLRDRSERFYEEAVADTFAAIDAVAAEKPDMIVLTENVFQTRVPISEDWHYRFNSLDGTDPDINTLCEKAAKYGTYIVCSVRQIDAEGLKHNTGLLINRQGKIQDTFHKCHLTIGEMEAGLVLGDDLAVFDTDFAKIGIQICWDHFFPESTRILTMKGAELICVPTHGVQLERSVARAVENGVFFAYAYTHREGTMITGPGQSRFHSESTMVSGPEGPILADAVEKGYAVADIDFNDIVRRPWLSCSSWGSANEYYLCERRANIYGTILENTFPGDNI